ncbi:MAG TPA: 23S rRNA (guanosine(2251)-2'-O)-methyltransferase RlmB [Stellaceae bacterium]|nr:23S rRNA (guanosine(2251)-2'-O)-methyltransferase RlmB [Stellaceae bacterium]
MKRRPRPRNRDEPHGPRRNEHARTSQSAPAKSAKAVRPAANAPRETSRESGLWLFGRHAVAAALANPLRRIRRLASLPEAANELRSLAAGAAARLPSGGPETLDRRALEALLPHGAVHQGMALSTEPLPAYDIDDVLDTLAGAAEPHVIVLLDQVTDPHNVGAILRSAAAFAARAVVMPEHGAPPVTGTLAKAASGALEAVPLLRVTNLARTLDRLKEAGFWCVGLEEEAGQVLSDLDPGVRIALVLGAEGSGLRRLTRERCDMLARLPTRGAPASLNVSNAAAIALYELTRRRP